MSYSKVPDSMSDDAQCTDRLHPNAGSGEDDIELYPRISKHWQKRCYTLALLLAVSLGANGLFLINFFSSPAAEARSRFAQLSPSLTVPFNSSGGYASTNLTEAAILWESIDYDMGTVALSPSWAKDKGLPSAQPFPWDRDQQVYILNGHHALHCLQSIHRSLREFSWGVEQSLPLSHIVHCLNALRDDVICYADDTPRYSTPTKDTITGEGQMRQCRDWNKLTEWAVERSACWSYISPKAEDVDQFKRFQFCPKDSPHWPAVRKHFGKPDDWFGEGAAEEVLASLSR